MLKLTVRVFDESGHELASLDGEAEQVLSPVALGGLATLVRVACNDRHPERVPWARKTIAEIAGEAALHEMTLADIVRHVKELKRLLRVACRVDGMLAGRTRRKLNMAQAELERRTLPTFNSRKEGATR